MQLDAFGVFAVFHGFQQRGLVFFTGKAADIDYMQRAGRVLIVCRRGLRADTRVRNKAVGNYLAPGFDMIAAQAVQDIFRRALHIVAMIEGKVPPGGEDFFVQAFPVHQGPQGIGDVLRMQVVGARDGLAQPLADFNHAVLNHKTGAGCSAQRHSPGPG